MDFSLPDAKRVRRADLASPSSSPDPEADPRIESALHTRLAALYGPISLSPIHDDTPAPNTAGAAPSKDVTDPAEDDAQDEGFEFRLFSTGASARKITLDDEEEGEGGFVRTERGRGYYFKERAEGEERERFAFAAVSGEEVLRGRERRNWGLEVPWRVRVLSCVGQNVLGNGKMREVLVGVGGEGGGKRKKLGKKRRIVLRERKRKRDAVEEAKREERKGKEEAEREKKTRRNREKKVKRKLKEKAKKAGDGGVSGQDVQSGSE